MKIFAIVSGVGVALSLAACGGGGGNPGASSGGNSSTVVVTPTPTPVPTGRLLISSNSYPDGGDIPLKYASQTQNGSNVSPGVLIQSVPAATKSLAIIMDDETPPCGLSNKACVHWNVFNLPPSITTVDENHRLAIIKGVRVGPESGSTFTGYLGPYPPNTHIYKTTVYALSVESTVLAAAPRYTRSQFEATYGAAILDKMTWTGRFTPKAQ